MPAAPTFADLLDAWLAGGPAESLDRAVAGLSLHAVLALADACRAGHGLRRYLEPAVARAQLARAPGLGPAALLSLHRSGYVREIALAALADSSDLAVLRFLALRLDDIVEKIRDRARVEIVLRLVDRAAPEVAAILPLVVRLSSRRRAGGGGIPRAVEAYLIDPARGLAALLVATRSPEAELRLAAVPLALRRAPLGDTKLDHYRAALADPEPKVARWAAFELTSTRCDPAVRDALLPLVLAHRDPALRRRAVLAYARLEGGEARVERALLDPRAEVRGVARAKLRDGRSRALYLRVLEVEGQGATRREVLGALAGLAEVGRRENAPVALRWVESSDPLLQAEAVRCLAMLAPWEHRALLEEKRRSRYRRVRREAERALRALGEATPHA
jgi:hypothetical protein